MSSTMKTVIRLIPGLDVVSKVSIFLVIAPLIALDSIEHEIVLKGRQFIIERGD